MANFLKVCVFLIFISIYATLFLLYEMSIAGAVVVGRFLRYVSAN